MFALLFASFLAPIDLATAQETRAEVVQQEQAMRQQTVAPPQSGAVERFADRLEDWGIITGEPRGLYPWFGSVYPGGSFAGGAGYRKPLGDDGELHAFGGYSIERFSRAQVDLGLPSFARRAARLTLSGRFVNAPDVRYFGVGNSSHQEDETRFGYRPLSAGATLDVQAGRYLTLAGGASYLDIRTAEGRTAPLIGDAFTPANTPGLELTNFTYVHTTGQAVVDWRRRPGYSGSGGLYRVQANDFRELDTDLYSFRSVEAEVLQLIPILRANWVVALRGLATVTDLDDTSLVPYFMLPSLGGGRTLRGYPDFRFRDRNRLLMNAELRWTPARFMDMAIFYDTGKVASDWRDLDFEDLKESYGIGMRLVGARGYVFRIEAAHSREHDVRLIFTAGGAF